MKECSVLLNLLMSANQTEGFRKVGGLRDAMSIRLRLPWRKPGKWRQPSWTPPRRTNRWQSCFQIRRRVSSAVTEISDIPARALQLKTRSRHLLYIGAFATFGAISKNGVGHFLQNVLRMTAIAAFVCIDRHGKNPKKNSLRKPLAAALGS